MEPIINLVKRPRIPGGIRNTATSAWVSDNGTPTATGGSDRIGMPIKGLVLDSTTSNTLIEVPEGYGVDPLQPGDELQLWLLSDVADVTAGLYRDRTAPADQQVAVDPKSASEPGATLTVPEGDGELWLKLQGESDAVAKLVRLSPAGSTDSLGVFDGSEEDTEEIQFLWTGEGELSPSVAVPVAPTPPSSSQGGVYERIAKRVQRYLDSDTDLTTIMEHAEVITAYAYGYTRGRGFQVTGLDMIPYPQIENVIVAVTAKLTYNPEQVVYYQTGDYSERPQYLTGWTLMEQAVLNNYRRRWA